MDEAVEKALEGNLALQAHWRKALVSIEQNLRLNERLSTRLQRTLALIRTPGAGLSVGQGVVYPRRLPPFFIDKRRETPQSNPDVLSFGGSAGHSKPDLLFGSAAWRVGDLKKLRGAIERQLKINRYGQGPTDGTDLFCSLLHAIEVDWEKIALEVGTKRSPLDCQTQWFNSQTPLIPKTTIAQAELERLLQIAHSHGYRDWDTISQELNTGRPAWQVFQAYRIQTLETVKARKWTPTEDALLETVVAQVGCKSWALVASRIPGRTPGQCLHRYTYRLAPGNVKGKWTKEEDAYLQLGVDTFGRGKWSQVATLVPTRNDSQCRERWERYLNPEIKKSPWTKEEQDQLKALVATHGLRKWAFISKEMGGTRSDDQLKRMWKTLERERDKEEERLLGLELAEETPRIVSESTTSPVVELAETATRNANGETPVGPSTSRKRPRTKT